MKERLRDPGRGNLRILQILAVAGLLWGLPAIAQNGGDAAHEFYERNGFDGHGKRGFIVRK